MCSRPMKPDDLLEHQARGGVGCTCKCMLMAAALWALYTCSHQWVRTCLSALPRARRDHRALLHRGMSWHDYSHCEGTAYIKLNICRYSLSM